MTDFLSLKSKLNGTFSSTYVLFGNDDWLIGKSIDNILATLDIAMPEINVVRFEQETSDIDGILVACNTYPFFSNQKMVIVEKFKFAPNKDEQKRAIEKFAVLNDTNCVLVFIAEDESTFGSVRGVEQVDCNHLSQSNVAKWVKAFCENNGKHIDSPVASKIAEYCLCDMSRVSVETQKLCDFCNAEISATDVDTMVHRDVEYAVFDLGQTIAARNVAKALEILASLVASGEKPNQLFVVMYNYYRRLYYFRNSVLPSSKIAEGLGVRESALYYVKEVAEKYKPIQLSKALALFEKADVKLKIEFGEEEVLKDLILQLISL